ncbi:MAG: hypothetical protein NC485_13075 [Ruminococcus flavefaciens]|nr:hypothetical protein [Ruminococcus flavefaciens]MCM1062359.1 hypothetical protein [Eubacterium sp.]
MSDFNFNSSCEGVPVRVNRVFDSCSDKDCLAEIPVTISSGTISSNINIVRSRAASVENVSISVEPVPFNKGFYSIDITFTFSLEILGYENSKSMPIILQGTAYASKNCILYGSESSVKTFTDSETCSPMTNNPPCRTGNPPTASVSVLEPVILETNICRHSPNINDQNSTPQITVTLGLFSVIELSRPVTIMVPTLDYTIPHKQCCNESDSPCEVFEKLKFPEEEFSPQSLCGCEEECDNAPSDMS